MIKRIIKFLLSMGLVIYASLACLILILGILSEYASFDWIPFISVFGIGFLYAFIHLFIVVFILIIRKKWLWVAFSCFILFWASKSIGRYYHAHDPPSKIPSESYSILSINLGGLGYSIKEVQDNCIKVANVIATEKPDIIFFQEFWIDRPIYQPFQSDMDSLGYHYSISNGSIHTYSKTKVTITEKLKERWQHYALIGDIRLNDSTTLRTYNLHLESNRVTKNLDKVKQDTLINNKIDQSKVALVQVNDKRKRRLGQAKRVLEKVKNSPHRVLVGGDFNSTPHSLVYREFEDELDDHFCQAGSGLGTSYNKIPLLKIDYLFSDKNKLKPISHHVLRNLNVSDHDPIISIFKVVH